MNNLIPGVTYYRSTWRDFFQCDVNNFNDVKQRDTQWRVAVLEDFLFPDIKWEIDQFSINLIYQSPLSGVMRFGRPNKGDIRDKQLLICDLLQHFGWYNTQWYGAITTLHDLKDIRLMLKFMAPFFGMVGVTISDDRILRAKALNLCAYPYLTWPDFNYDIPYLVRRDKAVENDTLRFIDQL